MIGNASQASSEGPSPEWLWPRISTGTRKNAMDWSLALTSQGIPSMIHAPDTITGWALGVPGDQISKARAVIQQYEMENRSFWRYRLGPLPDHGKFGIHFGALIWVFCVIGIYFLQIKKSNFADLGMMNAKLVSQGEWYRLVTATWLHSDMAHLAGNLTSGSFLLGITLFIHGPGLGFFLCQLAGAAANGVGYLSQPEYYRSLGASGLVMGALGILSVDSIKAWRNGQLNGKQVYASFAGGIMLFALMGFAPGSDWIVHAAGFFSGALIGWMAGWIPDKAVKSAWLQTFTLAISIFLVTYSWISAVK